MHEAHRARLGPVLPFSVLPPLSRARGPCDLWSCCENGSSPLFPAPSVLAQAVTVPESTPNIGPIRAGHNGQYDRIAVVISAPQIGQNARSVIVTEPFLRRVCFFRSL